MSHPRFRSLPIHRLGAPRAPHALGLLRQGVGALAVMGALGMGCLPKEDTTPPTPLGKAMYGMLCDRIGALALREDLTGESFRRLCHEVDHGEYEDKVRQDLLPPLDPSALDVDGKKVSIDKQKTDRQNNIGRVEALARHRKNLIDSFESLLPILDVPLKDTQNPDPDKTCKPATSGPKTGELREEFARVLGRLLDLIGDGTVTRLSESMGEFLKRAEGDADAHGAVARLVNRDGYQPSPQTYGLLRQLLSYPKLPDLADAFLRLVALGPGTEQKRESRFKTAVPGLRLPTGKAAKEFESLLEAANYELQTLEPSPPPPDLVSYQDPVFPNRVILSRPRELLEFGKFILFTEFTPPSPPPPGAALKRDNRGAARVLMQGRVVPAPFLDQDGDGLPDLDEVGQFKTAGGAVPTPFARTGSKDGKRDPLGRALMGNRPIYDYVQTDRILMASTLRDIRTLVAAGDHPEKRDAIIDALGAVAAIGGLRDPQPQTVRSYTEVVGSKSVQRQLRYRGFHADSSPLVDLAYAIGVVASLPETADVLTMVRSLLTDNPAVAARIVGALLQIMNAASNHPEATLSERSTFIDEFLDYAVRLGREPGMLEDLMAALNTNESQRLLGILGQFVTYKDEFTYQRDAAAPEDETKLNGPLFNLSAGRVVDAKTPFVVPVDRSKPDTGTNRSILQRLLQAGYDIIGVPICSKPNAIAKFKVKFPPDSPIALPVEIDFPKNDIVRKMCTFIGAKEPENPAPACAWVHFPDPTVKVLEFLAGKLTLDLPDECLDKVANNEILNATGLPDMFAEIATGLKGLKLSNPQIGAAARLLHFDAPYDPYPQSPGYAGSKFYPKTRDFIAGVLDPLPTNRCPLVEVPGPLGSRVKIRKCNSFADTMRARNTNILFALDTFDMLKAIRPVGLVFDKYKRVDLIMDPLKILHRHWGTERQSKAECDPSRPSDDFAWCAQSGVSRMEPVIAEALRGDVGPALAATIQALQAMRIPHCNGYDAKRACTGVTSIDGIKALAEFLRALIDPARSQGLTDRRGNSFRVRNDGAKTPYVTPALLLLDSLNGMTKAFSRFTKEHPEEGDLGAKLSLATSHIIETFLKVDGQGPEARFRNPALVTFATVSLDALKAQVEAHCLPGEAGGCPWLRREVPNDLATLLEGPVLPALGDLMTAVRHDRDARRELMNLVEYLVRPESETDTLGITVDLVEILGDQANLGKLFRLAGAAMTSNSTDPKAPVGGLVRDVIDLTGRLFARNIDARGQENCGAEIDPNRIFTYVLPQLVRPLKNGLIPIEVFGQALQDVNRRPAGKAGPLNGNDVKNIVSEVGDAFTDPRSGMIRAIRVVEEVLGSQRVQQVPERQAPSPSTRDSKTR